MTMTNITNTRKTTHDDIFTAAIYGHLPADFDCWDLADKYGTTVAHVAARYGHLPPGFDRWDLVPERYRPRA